MPFVPFADCMQANIRFTLYGVPIENCFTVRYDSLDFKSAVDLVDPAFETAWWNVIRVVLSHEIAHVESYYVDLSSVSGPVETKGTWTSPAGQSAINALPGSLAACVTLRTDQRGRSFRGRSYISGIPLDKTEGNQFTTDVLGQLNSAYANLLAELGSNGMELCVASRVSGGVERTTGVATRVSSAACRDRNFDSQRGRLTA